MTNRDKIIALSFIIVAFSVLYFLVIRPISLDRKLDSCLDSMWSFYGNDDIKYAQKTEGCYREVGR
jgi:hypothetical protein